MPPTRPSSQVARVAGIAAVVGLLSGGIALYSLTGRPEANETAVSEVTPTPSTSTATTDTPASATTDYRDGSYSATGTYRSPGGTEELGVRLTVGGGVVTAAETTPEASSATAREYQARFIAGYKAQVVGKKLDELKLDRISGSSLTSQGFNDAVTKIKAQARS